MKQAVKWVDVKADIVVKQVAALVTNDTWESDEYPLMWTECEHNAFLSHLRVRQLRQPTVSPDFDRIGEVRFIVSRLIEILLADEKMMRVTYFHCTGLP